MDPISNPFVPSAGTPPPTFSGRESVLERGRITIERTYHGRHAKSLMLIGLRGVGKTVLLNRLEQLAKDVGFITLPIEAPENKSLPKLLVPHLRRALLSLDRAENISKKVRWALRVLGGFASALRVKFDGFDVGLDLPLQSGIADSGDLEADLTELFIAVGEAAASKETAVAIFIDELQYLDESELSALIMAMHRASQKVLPLLLIGAGLPQLAGAMGRSKSYAERLFEFPEIGALSKEETQRALVDPVVREGAEISVEAVSEIHRSTQGYPYFVQEWGYHAWNAALGNNISAQTVKSVNDVTIKRLDESFFRVRLDRLTPREREYLRAMAALGPGPHRSGDIAEKLDVQVRSVAPLRSGLIKKGMIYSPAHGDTAFTVPLFDEFMCRIMPEFPVL